MAAVLTAATALDSAIASFNTALAAYVQACGAANAAARKANGNSVDQTAGGHDNQRLGSWSNIRAVMGQNFPTAYALGMVPSAGTLTLAQINAAD